MPPTAKKISTVAEIGTIADEDYVPTIDVSAATPAAKGVRATYAKIATYILSKYPVPSQAAAEAGAETVARLWTAERVKQAIDAALSGGGSTNNWTADRAPLGTDDITAGYTQGSLWRWDLRVWICVANATNIASWVELTGAGSSLTNPMTAAGDLIIGGVSGAPARLAIGANGKILGIVAGAVAWIDGPTGAGLDEAAVNSLIDAALTEVSALTDPTTTAGDLIVRGASALARLAIGVDGKLLGVVAGAPAWVDPPATGGTNTLYSERSYPGDPVIAGGLFMIVNRAMVLVHIEASIEFGGTGTPVIAITKNSGVIQSFSLDQGALSPNEGYKYGVSTIAEVTVDPGDTLSISVIDTGEYMSSGAASGQLVAGLEWRIPT